MRRLLFNPLAQQPYASGEYSAIQKAFILDNPIVDNGLYFCIITATSTGEQIAHECCFLYLNEPKHTENVEYITLGVTYSYKLFISTIDSKKYVTIRNLLDDSVIDSSLEYTIYLYKVI